MKKIIALVSVFFLVFSLFPVMSLAATNSAINTGTITGYVTESRFNLPIGLSGVTVTLKQGSSETNVLTGRMGVYTLTKVPAGEGLLLFYKDGYTQSEQNVIVKAGKITNVNKRLVKANVAPSVSLSGKVKAEFKVKDVLAVILRLYPDSLSQILDLIIPESPIKPTIITEATKLNGEDIIALLDNFGVLDTALGNFNPQKIIDLIPNISPEIKNLLLKIVPSSISNQIALPGTLITVKDDSGRLMKATLAATDGSYKLSIPGNYKVEFTLYGFETRILNATDVGATTFLVASSGTVRGTITAPDNNPVAGALVTVTTAEGTPSAISDSAGKYEIKGIKTLLPGFLGGIGAHTVLFDKEGYSLAQSTAKFIFGYAKVDKKLAIAPQFGNLEGLVDTKIPGAWLLTGGITVDVYDSANMLVDTEKITAKVPDLSNLTTRGKYSFNDLPIGIYKVSFSASWYRPQTVTDVVIRAGRTTTLDQTIGTVISPSGVKGYVKYNSILLGVSIPLPLKDVLVNLMQGDEVIASTTTSGDLLTNYAFDNLLAGNYKAVFTKSGYSSQTVENIVVTEANNSTLPEVTMVPMTGVLKGTVKSGGKNLGGVSVTVKDSSSNTLVMANTSEPFLGMGGGTYSMNVPVGDNYTITFEKAGYASKTESVASLSIGQTITVDIILRELSKNANLASITPSKGILSPLFSPMTKTYTVELSIDETIIPTVVAASEDSNATIAITQPTSVEGTASIVVTAENKTTIETYTVNFVKAQAPVLASIHNVVAINGKVTITLVEKPTTAPIASDFTADVAIDSAAPAVLNLTDFDYDNGTKVTCNFEKISETGTIQSVVVAITMSGIQVSASAFTIVPFEVASTISTVEATNGTVKITLNEKPTVTPVASDFSARVGTTTLSLVGFSYDDNTIVTYSFDPIAETGEEQHIVVTITLQGIDTSANAFTIPAATGVLKGTVSKKVVIYIPRANVTVNVKIADGRTLTATTSISGTYRIESVPIGIYTVEFIDGSTTKTAIATITKGIETTLDMRMN